MNVKYNPKWVIIIHDVDNKPVTMRQYESKADAISDLRYHSELGYYVTMVAYSVWANRHMRAKA